jgi:hypothetical protein
MKLEMKTLSEIKFDKIISEGFHELLKPLGFKKKGNNFYLRLDTIGQIVNVQKSAFGNRDNISFTINTGIFVSVVWLAFFDKTEKGIPEYPNEAECLIRKRIGNLRKQSDIWFEIQEHTDEQQLIEEIRINLKEFILPYFDRLISSECLLHESDNLELWLSPLIKLLLLGELKQFDKAHLEYERLLTDETNPKTIEKVILFGQKYGLDKRK